jgi:hypothetical protein
VIDGIGITQAGTVSVLGARGATAGAGFRVEWLWRFFDMPMKNVQTRNISAPGLTPNAGYARNPKQSTTDFTDDTDREGAGLTGLNHSISVLSVPSVVKFLFFIAVSHASGTKGEFRFLSIETFLFTIRTPRKCPVQSSKILK